MNDMKALMLKIAKSKSEADFYSKYPDEQSFMKVHGKAFKKAQMGMSVQKAQGGVNAQPYLSEYEQWAQSAQDNTTNSLDPNTPNYSEYDDFLKAYPNGNTTMQHTSKSKGIGSFNMGPAKNFIAPVGDLIGGIQELKGEREKLRGARQMKGVSNVMMQASATRPEQDTRNYVRPEDQIIQPNQLNNPYGNNTNILQGRDGTRVPKAQNGFTNFMGSQGGTDFASRIAGEAFGDNAGARIGGAVGSAISMIPGVGPIAGMIAKPILTAIGGAIDTNGRKIKNTQQGTYRNIGNMAFNNNMQGSQQQYTSYMQDGGNMDGDLQTGEGGYAKPVSYNPYLPDGGETVMFQGRSHDEGGIDTTYGNNPVEVEGGEPATKMEDGSMTVFGNLKIPKGILGDPKANGKKFKGYVANLSKEENKHNKTIESSTEKIGDMDTVTSFDKLRMSSLKANIMGANMKLKEIADKKTQASHLQEAINNTADEYGIVADDLSRGKIKKAQWGTNVNPYAPWIYGNNPETDSYKVGVPAARTASKSNTTTKKGIPAKRSIAGTVPAGYNPSQLMEQRQQSLEVPLSNELEPMRYNTPKGKEEKFPWGDLFNNVLPWFRPTDSENLNANQLMGEMYAMSNNQLEPVKAQTYHPQLDTPYDISLQDSLNENQADYRATQRMMGGNPAAMAMLNAQKYGANQKVLGEQFRMNQAQKDKVYSQNRNVMNDAQLKNLAIYDQQYGRQAEAKSNTKALTQAALSSISDKFAKNKLENRELQTYENLYNYRYDSQGRAINMNGIPQWNTSIGDGNQPGQNGATSRAFMSQDGQMMIPQWEGGRIVSYKPARTAVTDEANPNVHPKKKTTTHRNGGIVNAIKNL